MKKVYLSELADRKGIILIEGELTRQYGEYILKLIKMLKNRIDVMKIYKSKITVYINSPGGDLLTGIFIYEELEKIKPYIRTVIVGKAAGISGIIFLAGNERLIESDSEFGFYGIRLKKPIKTYKKCKETAGLISYYKKTISDILCSRTALDESKIEELFKNKYTSYKCNTVIRKEIATGKLEGTVDISKKHLSCLEPGWCTPLDGFGHIDLSRRIKKNRKKK